MKMYFVGYFNDKGGCNMLSTIDEGNQVSEHSRLFNHKAGAFELLHSLHGECDGRRLDVIEFDLSFCNARVV